MNTSLLKYEIQAFSDRNAFQMFFRKKRHETVINEVKKIGLKNVRVLDVGCGIGRESIRLAKMGYSVVGVDVNASFIEYAKKQAVKNKLDNISFYHVDIEKKIKRRLGKFQIALMSEVIEHTRRWRMVLKNISDLIDDGYLVLTTPNYSGLIVHECLWSLKAKCNWFETHHTRFNVRKIESALNEFGFKPIKIYTFFYFSHFTPFLSIKLADFIFDKELKYLSGFKFGALIMCVSRKMEA